MQAWIYGAVNPPEDASAVIRRIRQDGFKENTVRIGGAASPDGSARPHELFVDYGHSVWVGVGLGVAIGVALGIALLAYMDSDRFNHWGGVISIPIWSACGWGLFGMIVGGSGIFSEVGRTKRNALPGTNPARVVISVELRDPQELERARTALTTAGATEVWFLGER